MSRRKGTPCACNSDPCSCGSSKGKCIRAINNVSPDPNGDFNIKAGAGIAIVQSNDDEITVINTSDPDAFLAGDNIEIIDNGDGTRDIRLTDEPVIDGLTVNGDTQLNGDLEVNGDIIQNGAAYETHAEQVYSRDDYIIMRDGAIAALAPGDYSGFQVKLYDGVNDGRLVIDNAGVARVGDVGDEQPLMTRDESADLTDGDALIWDAANQKAIGQTFASMISAFTDFQYESDSGRSVVIGSNTGFTDATVTAHSNGTYLLTMRAQFRVNSPGDDVVAYGFYFSGSPGTNVYLGNIYPNGLTGLYRVSCSFMFTMTAGQTAYPIVYRTGTGSATSTDSFARCEIIRVA